MKVSLNWLRTLVELPPTTDELVTLLTMAGVEVEGIEKRGADFPFVVVSQITAMDKHPNADRLSVCQVDDGSGTPRQIVTGATNQKVGDKIPCALPGAVLPGDFRIKEGKLRGVDSNGMLCSSKELELAADAEGLMILSPDARIGAPIVEVFPADTVLDLEITPNRADLLSHHGIATEIAVLTGKKVTIPAWEPYQPTDEQPLSVAIETTSPATYSASLIRGAKIGPSPDWLRSKLESIGLRAINNAVDVTNYILHFTGQPCHVFDAAKVTGTIRVRDARDGETILALDGKTYTLTTDDLVIADDHAVLAIAGVMGGAESGVTDTTTDVILEIANFEPKRIRRTSRRLGLSSDSSYRFERGVDVSTNLSLRGVTAALLAKLTAAQSYSTVSATTTDARVEDYAAEKLPIVPLRTARVAALLGVEVPEARIEEILTGFGLTKTDGGWKIPTRRGDLTREVDLIEEIARVIGMEAVPQRTIARFAPASGTDRAYDRAMSLRRALAAQGLHEARSITLVPAQPLGLAQLHTSTGDLLRVKNPMNDEQVVLRPNLLHGLLTAARDNARAGAASIRLFEIGRVFNTRRPEEFSHAAIVLAGPGSTRDWRGREGREADLADLKAIITTTLGGGNITFEKDENPASALSVVIKVNAKPVGHAGQIWPADARALGIETAVLFAELDLAAISKAAPADGAKKYREIPRFPATSRDIAMLAPLTLSHAEIERALTAAKEPLLSGIELFDVFTDATGEKIPADKKSLAYSLTYRSPERTLTADEVNTAHTKLKQRLATLGVTLRE